MVTEEGGGGDVKKLKYFSVLFMFNTNYAHVYTKLKQYHLLKQKPESNFIRYGLPVNAYTKQKHLTKANTIHYVLPANVYTKTEAFDQHLFFLKSVSAIHYNSHYHRGP